jgi:hypothetical protein
LPSTKRYVPPIRRSISQIGIDQCSPGPRSQRRKSLGFVQASKTAVRTALKLRVIRIVRSPSASSRFQTSLSMVPLTLR